HGHEERDLAARSDHHIARRDIQIASFAQIVSQRLLQSRHANYRTVTILAFPQRSIQSFIHARRGMEIRLSEFKVNDGTALLFQFLGSGEDGEGSLAAHYRHS